jgi:hypothetical protein
VLGLHCTGALGCSIVVEGPRSSAAVTVVCKTANTLEHSGDQTSTELDLWHTLLLHCFSFCDLIYWSVQSVMLDIRVCPASPVVDYITRSMNCRRVKKYPIFVFLLKVWLSPLNSILPCHFPALSEGVSAFSGKERCHYQSYWSLLKIVLLTSVTG